jgi:hypothetical protein
MIVSQKSQSWRPLNCALVKVDKLGTFSERYSGRRIFEPPAEHTEKEEVLAAHTPL